MKPRKNFLVLKLGGSLITDKKNLETLDMIELNNCSIFVAEMKSKYQHIIVFHGAGSFGHIKALELRNNWQNFSRLQRKKSIQVIQASIQNLHQLVLTNLQHQGGLNVESFLTFLRDKPTANYQDVLASARSGRIPVLGGDIDQNTHTLSIRSGDTIMQQLDTFFPTEATVDYVFLTRTGGVLDAQKNIMPSLPADWNNISATQNDITGGMKQKIAVARLLKGTNRKIFITSPTHWQKGEWTQVV